MPAATVRDQAGRGARAGPPAPGAGRDPGDAGVPARPDADDAAAAPVAAAPRARVPARRCAAACATAAQGSLRAIRTMAGQLARDRRHAARAAAQALPQGAAAGLRARRPPARRARRPPPARALRARHDDRHVAGRVHHRPPVQLHRPRARHLQLEAQPQGLAAAQAAGGAVRRHLHRGQRPPPEGDRAGRRRPPRLPRAVGGLHDAAARTASRPQRNGRLRILGVGRLVAKKGFDTLVDACAVLRDRGVAVRRADRRPGRQGRRGAAAAGSPSSTCRSSCPAPSAPRRCSDEYRRAGALCMPCRLLPTDRDGIPNVLVEAMAAGAPVVATAVSGIPELVEHEVNGLLIPPDDPEALADALLRLHDDPELTATLTRNGRETVKERFDGERLAQRAGGAVHRGGGAVSALTVTRPRPVFCVNEHEHRDRELAEAVAARPLQLRRRNPRARPRARLAAAPTCPRTRSGGSTGSSSITGSTSPTRSAPPATAASWTRGRGSSPASCSRSRRTTTRATSPPAGS